VEQSPTYYTIADVCRELRVSRSTINQFLDNGLKVTRVGRCVRIAPGDLETFKQARREPVRATDTADHSAA